jgi:Flp pilus assembly protein TadG
MRQMKQGKPEQFRDDRGRHGIALIWAAIAMTVLIGFSSLAVDWGRVQLVKTELQRTADAAARHGATGIVTSGALSRYNAKAAASDNTADGATVGLDNADVTFGYWDNDAHSFSANASPWNACRVTVARTKAKGNPIKLYLAAAIGYSEIDVVATSTAYSTTTSGYGMIVVNGTYMNGNCEVDSFTSSVGSYASTVENGAKMASSFTPLDMVGIAQIRGDVAYTGPSAPSGNITGARKKIDALPPTPTPTVPPGATNHGNYNNGNVTLTSGDHFFTSFTSGGNDTVTINASGGPVRIYCAGQFKFSGNARFVYLQTPSAANLEINITGSGTVEPSEDPTYARINAPNSHLMMRGNSDIYGAVTAKSIEMRGGDGIHLDSSLSNPGGTIGGPIAIVE